MANDTFYPTEIDEQPLPNSDQAVLASNAANPTDTQTPGTVTEKKIPKAKVARILISESLDTLAKRIKGVFQFGKSGAIKIGEQTAGVSGEVNISPNGITAVDQAGLTTFSIDATTGNATFKGAVQAGSLIAGDSLVRIESENGHGRIVVNDGVDDRILIGYQENGF